MCYSSPQVETETLREGTTGYIAVTPSVPPRFLCDSTKPGTVHVEAVLKRSGRGDYSCKQEGRSIKQAVFSSVDTSNAACGSLMDNAAWTSGKAYRIKIRPKDDSRRERTDYIRTVSLHLVKTNGGREVCRRYLKDVSVCDCISFFFF